MELRTLGNSSLKVSCVGFGCSRIGGSVGGGNASDAAHILNRAFDAGITYFDTANIYGQGRSEALLGRVFQGRRDQVILATKGGYQFSAAAGWLAKLKPLARKVIRLRPNLVKSVQKVRASQIRQDFSSEGLMRSLEGSLRRLKTDTIDLYQLHSPPLEVLEQGDVFATLESMKTQGKIREYGVACLEPDHALACLSGGVASAQIELNFIRSEGLTRIVPRTQPAGVGVVARQLFASGRLLKNPNDLTAEDFDGDAAAVERIREGLGRLRELGPLTEVALRYFRQKPGIDVVLFGTTRKENLETNLLALERAPLSSSDIARIDSIVQEGMLSNVH